MSTGKRWRRFFLGFSKVIRTLIPALTSLLALSALISTTFLLGLHLSIEHPLAGAFTGLDFLYPDVEEELLTIHIEGAGVVRGSIRLLVGILPSGEAIGVVELLVHRRSSGV